MGRRMTTTLQINMKVHSCHIHSMESWSEFCQRHIIAVVAVFPAVVLVLPTTTNNNTARPTDQKQINIISNIVSVSSNERTKLLFAVAYNYRIFTQ